MLGRPRRSEPPNQPPREASGRSVERTRLRDWFWLGPLLAAFGWFYFFAGSELIRVGNHDPMAYDQKANIDLATRSVEDSFPQATNGTINPLWPWLTAKLLGAPAETPDFFLRGKQLNLALSLGFLALLALCCSRYLPALAVLVVTLLCAFGALLERAVFFQPEPLFYALFLASWACCLALLVRNPLWLYPVAGLVTSFAWLAKASTDLLILTFLAAGTLRLILALLAKQRGLEEANWRWQRHVVGLVLFAITYALPIVPRGQVAAERWGDPLHSTAMYCMWLDDWDTDAVPWIAKWIHTGRIKHLPKDERPSCRNWWKTHTFEQFSTRLTSGVATKFAGFVSPEGGWRLRNYVAFAKSKAPKKWKTFLTHRGLYLGALLGLLGAMIFAACLNRKDQRRDWDSASIAAVSCFASGAFILYLLAFGWYDPIGSGQRFMLGLWMPLVCTLAWAAEWFRRTASSMLANRIYLAVYIIVALGISMHTLSILRYPIFGDAAT